MNRYVIALLLVASTNITLSVRAAGYPDLYPNQKLKKSTTETVRHDINECRIAGEDYVTQSGNDGSAGRGALKGAAKGAGVGALAGTIMGQSAGRGAGAGAALGGLKSVAGSYRDKRDGSPEYKNFVEACLEDKGYKVVGWKKGA